MGRHITPDEFDKMFAWKADGYDTATICTARPLVVWQLYFQYGGVVSDCPKFDWIGGIQEPWFSTTPVWCLHRRGLATTLDLSRKSTNSRLCINSCVLLIFIVQRLCGV